MKGKNMVGYWLWYDDGQVMEIRPSIKWDKGCALEYLLDTLGFSDSSDVLPLYIGDDRTDEDAFKVFSIFIWDQHKR